VRFPHSRSKSRLLAGVALLFAAVVSLQAQTPSASSDCAAPRPPQSSVSPDSVWRLAIEVAEAGQRLMRLSERASGRVTWAQTVDLVGYRWSSDSRWLVYAVSPIYDKPGIYVYDTRMGRSRRVVAARNRSTAYPDGADWFTICSLVPRAPGHFLVTYIQLPHVDSVDFAHFPANAPRHSVLVP
jgi:hypothetical protein